MPHRDMYAGILKRIHVCIHEGKVLHDIERKRLERDIEQLKEADFVHGMIARGLWASCLGDEAQAIACHERALLVGGRTRECLRTYAMSMRRLLLLPRSFELFREIFVRQPHHVSAVLNLSLLCVLSGNLALLKKVLVTHRRAVEAEHPSLEYLAEAVKYVMGVDACRIREEDLRRASAHALQSLSDHDLHPADYSVFLLRPATQKSLQIRIRVQPAAVDLQAINALLRQEIREDPDIESMDRLELELSYR